MLHWCTRSDLYCPTYSSGDFCLLQTYASVTNIGNAITYLSYADQLMPHLSWCCLNTSFLHWQLLTLIQISKQYFGRKSSSTQSTITGQLLQEVPNNIYFLYDCPKGKIPSFIVKFLLLINFTYIIAFMIIILITLQIYKSKLEHYDNFSDLCA